MYTVLTFLSIIALLLLQINGVEKAKWKSFREDRKMGKQLHIFASCRTQRETGYNGAGAFIAVYNPSADAAPKYSAAKMKLHIRPDSIEAGWRVDPALYGDNKTQLYIRTDASSRPPGSHCFNTQCDGFVVTNKSIPLNVVLDKISKPGEIYGIDLSIISDDRWILQLAGSEVGYWPDYIFRQPGAADYVEWGGEVSGRLLPGMGASHLELSDDTDKDAFFSNVKVIKGPTDGGPAVDPTNVECSVDNLNYEAKDKGNVGGIYQYLIFYGGPPRSAY